MARKSKGRGTAAAFGMLLLFAGLVGGGVLYMRSVSRPSAAVDGFARASVGCTTTLRFTETGTFFVFKDLGPVNDAPSGGCQPAADPTQTFAFELRGNDGPVVPRADDQLSYDTDDHLGNSVARIEIDSAGEYQLVVVGDDPAVAAAIGRDPDDGVDELRQRAILVATFGVVLGVLLLVLAGRRSNRAAAFLAPDGPGWGPRQNAERVVVPDEPGVVRSAVNPHLPDEQVSIAGPLSEVNELLSRPRMPRPVSPWAPPVLGGTATNPAVAEQIALQLPHTLEKQAEEVIVDVTDAITDEITDAVTDIAAGDPDQPTG